MSAGRWHMPTRTLRVLGATIVGMGLALGLAPEPAVGAAVKASSPAPGRASAPHPALVCSVHPTRPLLGHAVHWEIRARDLAPLPLLQASQLGSNWLLQGQSSESSGGPGGHIGHIGHIGHSQTLDLRLYPLVAGRLRLPGLGSGNARCPPRSLRIAAAQAGQAPRYIAARVVTPGATVGQALRIELDLASAGGLSWEPASAHSDDGMLRALNTLDTRVAAQGGIEVRRQVWSFTPTHAGEANVRFGLLRAHRFGELLVYPAAALRWKVRPLPAYWPEGWPVGHARLRIEPAPARLELGASGVLRARLSGVQVGRRALLAMLRAEAHAPGLRFGTPRLRRRSASAHEAAPVWDIELPWRASRAGRLAYPELRVAYYDPEHGAPGVALADWGTLRVHDPRPLRFVLAWLAVGALVLALAMLRLGLRAARDACCRARWRRIARGGDAGALWRLWRQARERGHTHAPSLRAWVEELRCGGRGVRSPELDRLIEREQRRLYAAPRRS